MKRTLYLSIANGLIAGLFATCVAFSADVSADDPDSQPRAGESHVKIQIFFIPGDSTTTPPTPSTISRVVLHAAGHKGGDQPCSGFSDCAGLIGKMPTVPILVIPASGSTCVTVNWGGTWRTFCY